ncbi:MAG: redoxin domain-containing protein, partial [Pirellulales bacterium]
FTLQDYLGAKYSLSDWPDKRAIVVVFLGAECPLAKLYGSRLQEMSERYAEDEVQFVGINSNRQDSLEEIGHYARECKIGFPLLKDPGNRVADRFGAVRTPEAFVLDGERVIRYCGRIDDQFGVGYARGKKSVSELARAIDEVSAGKPVSTPVTEATGCYIGRMKTTPPSGKNTYAKHIAPILNEHCVRCHREGEIAPFALTSYEEIAGWGDTIAEVVRKGRMPPWHASPEHGKFANDARLADAEKQLIYDWVINGLPEGDLADLPPPPEFVDGWQIPTPDIVYRMPQPYKVPAKGVVEYQYFGIDAKIDEDLWIRAAEMRPGNRAVVHHLILFFIKPGQGRMRGEDALANGIATFAPGLPAMKMPDGYAFRVPAGSRLVMQAHYTPNGSEQTDQSYAGIVLADPKTVKHEISIHAAMNFRFLIPPGDKDYSVSATYRIGEDSLLYTLAPHMHYRGKSFRFTAKYPDGSQEILLDVPRYDFNWQNVYKFSEPKRIPESTEIQLDAHYDNSADNLLNPDPSRAVYWGDQTWEEMMIGTLSTSPINQDLRIGPPRVEEIDGEVAKRRVSFRYQLSDGEKAKKVYLAGSFNDWKPTAQAMDGPDADGGFKTSLDLAPGQYEYKFVLDGTVWRFDPGNRERKGYFLNSVLHVE